MWNISGKNDERVVSMQRSTSTVFIIFIVFLATTSTILAGDFNMDLTWDFFNKFSTPTGAGSFQRYHLINLGYETDKNDFNFMYDWYDDTAGENNTHSLTPWAIEYAHKFDDNHRIETGYWWVWDILDKVTRFQEFRTRYVVQKPLSDQTILTGHVGLKSNDQVSLTAGGNLTHKIGNLEFLAGINAIPVLDDIVLSEGRIPITAGASYQFSSGTRAHAYVTYLIGDEPEQMTNPHILPGNPYARLGFDFIIF